jgi:hypothetical protein
MLKLASASSWFEGAFMGNRVRIKRQYQNDPEFYSCHTAQEENGFLVLKNESGAIVGRFPLPIEEWGIATPCVTSSD